MNINYLQFMSDNCLQNLYLFSNLYLEIKSTIFKTWSSFRSFVTF